MKKILTFTLVLYSCLASSLTISDYTTMKDKNTRELCMYLNGLHNGFVWGELMELKSNEKSKLFCADKRKVSLNCLNYISLVDDQIKQFRENSASNLVTNNSPLEPTFYAVMRKVDSCN